MAGLFNVKFSLFEKIALKAKLSDCDFAAYANDIAMETNPFQLFEDATMLELMGETAEGLQKAKSARNAFLENPTAKTAIAMVESDRSHIDAILMYKSSYLRNLLK